MKKLGLWLLTLGLLTSCGGSSSSSTSSGGTTVHPQPGIAVEIQSYVSQFEARYHTTVPYLVDFDTASDTGSQTTNGTTVGVCKVWSDGYKEVRINRTWWNSQADITRKVLIFHELGHCSFNRVHDTRTEPMTGVPAEFANRPLSMMYPTINPIVYYYRQPQYTDYYENELVGPTSSASMMYMTDETYTSPKQDYFDGDTGDCVQFMN